MQRMQITLQHWDQRSNSFLFLSLIYFTHLKVKCFYAFKSARSRENRWHSICVRKVAWHFQRLGNSVNRYAVLCATRCARPIKISWHFASPSIFDKSGKKAIPRAGKVATRFSWLRIPTRRAENFVFLLRDISKRGLRRRRLLQSELVEVCE